MAKKQDVHGKWEVLPDEGRIHMKSSRVNFITINADAPIIGGTADWLAHKADLAIDIGLHAITTGNKVLDGQVRKIIIGGSDGILRFAGKGSASDEQLDFAGDATCGNIIVPMELTGVPGMVSDEVLDIALKGTAAFEDLKLPIPGFSHIKKIDLFIDGDIKLSRQS